LEFRRVLFRSPPERLIADRPALERASLARSLYVRRVTPHLEPAEFVLLIPCQDVEGLAGDAARVLVGEMQCERHGRFGAQATRLGVRLAGVVALEDRLSRFGLLVRAGGAGKA